MAKSCEHCGRSHLKGNTRSHSNIATRRWQKINLQRKKIGDKFMTICTSCIRSLNKKKARA